MSSSQASELTKQAVFGVSDGVTSSLGVVLPLALLHRSLVLPVLGLAICAAVGMGGGEYLGDTNASLPSATVMAVASFVGTLLPALPLLFISGSLGLALGVALTVAVAIVIAEVKATERGRRRSYVETFGILGVAAILTVALSLIGGGSGN